MKPLTEIRQELSALLVECEAFRLEKAAQHKKGVILTILAALTGVVLLTIGLIGSWVCLGLGVFFLVAAIIIFNIGASKHQKAYKTHFKSNILEQLIENMMPTVSYEANNQIQKSVFNSSQLFSTNYNIYNGEDYFIGTHKGISFEMSELDVKKQTTSTSYSNGQTRTRTSTTQIFKGLFIVISAKKSSYSETYVLPDTAEKLFGNFGKFLQKNIGSVIQRGSMIYLENYPEFEKRYVVYSTEEIESQRLLSENLIQSLMDIYEHWKKTPSFAFIHNKVYIALPHSKDLLKISLHKSLINNQDEVLKQFMDEIALSMNIIDELSDVLNQ